MLLLTESCPDNYRVLELLKVFVNAIRLATIAIPLIIIILGAVDFFKAITSKDDYDMKNASTKLIKRVIAGVIVFFIPSIVIGIFNLLNLAGVDYAGYISCANNKDIYTVKLKRFETLLNEVEKNNTIANKSEMNKLIDYLEKNSTTNEEKTNIETLKTRYDSILSKFKDVSDNNNNNNGGSNSSSGNQVQYGEDGTIILEVKLFNEKNGYTKCSAWSEYAKYLGKTIVEYKKNNPSTPLPIPASALMAISMSESGFGGYSASLYRLTNNAFGIVTKSGKYTNKENYVYYQPQQVVYGSFADLENHGKICEGTKNCHRAYSSLYNSVADYVSLLQTSSYQKLLKNAGITSENSQKSVMAQAAIVAIEPLIAGQGSDYERRVVIPSFLHGYNDYNKENHKDTKNVLTNLYTCWDDIINNGNYSDVDSCEIKSRKNCK